MDAMQDKQKVIGDKWAVIEIAGSLWPLRRVAWQYNSAKSAPNLISKDIWLGPRPNHDQKSFYIMQSCLYRCYARQTKVHWWWMGCDSDCWLTLASSEEGGVTVVHHNLPQISSAKIYGLTTPNQIMVRKASTSCNHVFMYCIQYDVSSFSMAWSLLSNIMGKMWCVLLTGSNLLSWCGATMGVKSYAKQERIPFLV